MLCHNRPTLCPRSAVFYALSLHFLSSLFGVSILFHFLYRPFLTPVLSIIICLLDASWIPSRCERSYRALDAFALLIGPANSPALSEGMCGWIFLETWLSNDCQSLGRIYSQTSVVLRLSDGRAFDRRQSWSSVWHCFVVRNE